MIDAHQPNGTIIILVRPEELQALISVLFQAWGLTTGTPNVIVGVTDGGAQVNHPDLAANMWVTLMKFQVIGLDDDDNGFVDDINGYALVITPE